MSEDRGKRITLQEVADATGLNINTLSRWSQPKTMQKVDVETAYALVQYFNCTLDELLEFVHPNAAVK
jgi:transcriptional regulator with XRE-family HTH domain